jgi:hypothetical protein
MPSLARLGVGRLFYGTAYGDLPPKARDEERAFLSTPRDNRSLRDEFAELRIAMAQAQPLTSLHRAGLRGAPLIVVTAQKVAQGGWSALQDDLATLSANVDHRYLPDATHAMLTENKATAATSSQAIRDVVNAVRAGTALTKRA